MPSIHPNLSSDSGLHIKPPRVAGFTMLELIHDGSCGSIYRARQDRLGRIVALKILPEWPPPTDVALERFNRASYVYAQVSHPNLLTLYDTGTVDGFHFASLEYVTGQTLQQHLAEVGASDERFATRLATQVLRALAALHARDICHRNLKPKNILLETNGGVRVIGLGLASCQTAFFSPHLDSRPIGTPHFMAPEMIRGCYADPRSDLYSLGVTLYVATTGQTPFEKGSPLAVMSRHLTEAAVPLAKCRPDLSEEFVSFVETLMAREPEHRFQSAKAAFEVAEALEKRQVPGAPDVPRMLPSSASRAFAVGSQEAGRRRGRLAPLRRALVVALASAAATALLVFVLLHVVTWFAGFKPAAAPAPGKAPAAATPSGPVTVDGAEAAEFTRLLEMEDAFRAAPAAGADAWAAYLSKFPDAPSGKRKIARKMLDLYLNKEEQNKHKPRAEARPGELDF
ncbi:MAG: serine/threonine-protein kinase [Planctomycetota bacterium]|nr:serine/threonine-protein kinase [Planctomycetota bacterium]